MKEERCLIEVTETRAIGSDRDTWMVMKRTKKQDKVTGKAIGGYSEWVAYKYPVTFEGCADYIEKELAAMKSARGELEAADGEKQ